MNEAIDLFDRARAVGDLALLNEALDRLRQLSTVLEDRVLVLSALGVALNTRYAWTGRRADLDEAVDVARLAASAPDHPQQTALLANLGNVLRVRYETSGDLVDLEEAIRCGRDAVRIASGDPEHRLVALNNLGLCLRIRFQATDAVRDGDLAVEVCAQAVELMPERYANANALLSNLAGAHQARSERTGDPGDLDQAITLGHRALDAAGPGSPRCASVLSNLGVALQIRSERTGDGNDLDEAITRARQAVEATRDGDPELAARLANLASARLTRFDRTREPGDVDQAVELLQQAVDRTPPKNPALPGRLSNLSVALRLRFEPAGDPADLRYAVEAAEHAVEALPRDHPGQPGGLSNLGIALRARFARTGDPEDAGRAADALQQAVDAIAPGHPERAVLLSNLGGVLHDRFELLGGADLPRRAVRAFREAAGVVTARPRLRAATGAAWGRVAAEEEDWPEAESGLTVAVGMLGRVAPRELGQEDQQRELARHTAVAADAAACALHAGDAGRAVVLLEQGRGVLLGQALDTRGQLTELTRAAPELAGRFDRARRALDAPPGRYRAGVAAPEPVEPRRRLIAEFEEIVAVIRDVPGFAGFLRPPELPDLLRLARPGPIVIVNVSTLRSDALILRPDGVEAVPLPLVRPDAVRERFAALPGDGDGRLTGLLDWLWRAIAEPVLGALELPASAEPARLWWVPTGLLSFLPLHAAQPADSTDCLLDRAVSSYAPTLRALAHARRPATPGLPRVLAVGAPSLPGESPLPATRRELALIEELLSGSVVALPTPTRTAVLGALESASWAHFACHAESDPVFPARSALLVPDPDGTRLSVADIARLRPSGADLAYLSACATARTATTLPDEVLHITSAFQLAGYRHVIGTLWPIPDQLAHRTARGFYGSVVQGRDARSDRAPRALHAAVRRLRARFPDEPGVWAAHIHAGA